MVYWLQFCAKWNFTLLPCTTSQKLLTYFCFTVTHWKWNLYSIQKESYSLLIEQKKIKRWIKWSFRNWRSISLLHIYMEIRIILWFLGVLKKFLWNGTQLFFLIQIMTLKIWWRNQQKRIQIIQFTKHCQYKFLSLNWKSENVYIPTSDIDVLCKYHLFHTVMLCSCVLYCYPA